MRTSRSRYPRPFRPLLLAAAALLGAAAPASAVPVTLSLGCSVPAPSHLSYSLDLQGEAPDSVAPGETFSVELAFATLRGSGLGPVLGQPVGTVSGRVTGASLATDGAVAKTAPLSALKFGPSRVQADFFYAPAAADDGGPLTIGPITAGPSGDPIVLRPSTFHLEYTRILPADGRPGGFPGSTTELSADCGGDRKAALVIRGSKPLPGPAEVASVSPEFVPAAGGTEVTLKGTAFAQTTTVFVNGASVPFRVIDDRTVVITTQPVRVDGSEGQALGVEVDTNFDRGFAEDGLLFAYSGSAPPTVRPTRPAITSASPTTATFGQLVTLRGSGLADVNEVDLGSGPNPPASTPTADSVVGVMGAPPLGQVLPVAREGRFGLTSTRTPATADVRLASAPVVDGQPGPAAPVLRYAGSFGYCGISVDWPKPASTSPVTAYEVYLDGALVQQFVRGVHRDYGPDPSLFGPDAACVAFPDAGTHTFTVRARDGAGHASALSAPLSVVYPSFVPDPATPSSVAIAPTATTASVSWQSEGEFGGDYVTGYDVYLDGSYVKTVTGLTATLSGLTPKTAYTVMVVARASGNVSSARESHPFTTLAAPAVKLPVVDRVVGTVRANSYGALFVTGSRLTSGLRAVRVGGVRAPFAFPVAGGLVVLAPPRPAGKQAVTVTTAAGTSLVTVQSYVTYTR